MHCPLRAKKRKEVKMRKLTNGTFSEDLALLMLMYGATDMGKTTQLSQIAKWYANHAPAKKIRMLTADSGTGPLQEEIANGQIEVLSLRRYHAPFGLLQRVVGMGYWNVEDDGIEPVTGKVKWKARPTADFEWDNVGGYFIEGTQAIAMLLLGDHTMTGRKLSQDVMYTYSQDYGEVDPKTGRAMQKSVTMAGASPSHYGDVQKFMTAKLIPDSGLLPVDFVVWTGHESRGEDDMKAMKYGPATVGRAAVADMVQLFQHVFHMDATVDTKAGVIGDRRAYFDLHPDVQAPNPALAPKWEAKISTPLSYKAEIKKLWPGGYVPLTEENGIEQFLEFMKRKQTEARARARILQNKAAAAAAGTAGTTGTTVPVAVPPVKP